jgi:GntR family transcriptional regulator
VVGKLIMTIVDAGGTQTLDKSIPRPLYVQLEEILRQEIFSQKYAETGMIPSEAELSRTYGVSRMTARAVVTQLVNDGLVRRVQGKGTFLVEGKIPATTLAYVGIREQLEHMGFRTTTSLVEFKLVEADAALAEVFGGRVGDQLFFVKRIRHVDDAPISLHLSWIPKTLCPTLAPDNMETEQLCHILSQDFSLTSHSVSETLESVLAGDKDASHLGVDVGFPLLLLQDINRTSTGRVFEYTKVYFRGDKVQLHFEYRP